MRLREFASLLGPLHPDGPSDRLARCHNIEDLRAEARRFLPRAVFDFVDGGSEEETTLRRACVPDFSEAPPQLTLSTGPKGPGLYSGIAPHAFLVGSTLIVIGFL